MASLLVSLILASSAEPGAIRRIIPVSSGAQLQKALDQAVPGDTLVLTAGTQYIGNFRLRNHPGAGWITLTTSQPERLPPPGTRLTPTLAAVLPKLVTPNQMRALEADAGSHHYRLSGLEIAAAPGVYSLGLLAIGQPDNPRLADIPHDFTLDHLYIHGDPAVGGKYGLRLEAAHATLSDSTVADIKSDAQDSQALTGCNGPGPFTIVNNHLEAAGENVMWGSCGMAPGVVPGDILMRGNYLYKPLSWRGRKWSVKNSFEIKNGQRIRLEGNVFENNWTSAQPGFMVQLTPRETDAKAPGVVRDIVFEHNYFLNSPMGVNILAQDDVGRQGECRQIVFRDNLFTGFGDPSLSAKLFQILGRVPQITIDHNTMLTSTGAWLTADAPLAGAKITNNIFSHAEYGVWGPDSAIDGPAIEKYLPGSEFRGNVIIGGSADRFPSGNLAARDLVAVQFDRTHRLPYGLSAASPYRRKGTDSRDPGVVSIEAIAASAEKAVKGRM